ncbi:protein kinase domain-containing protein [Thermocatellispora tengchongensis]|uniref:protein kinase domain-containing protein n=1 Tax=Thermocatellispora tengchongensis TaxID=1073253 RepID=UPI00362D4DF4
MSEFIDGPTLRAAAEAGERLRDAALHRFAVGTATALVAIHQTDVVHGDIGPGNVVLGPDGPRVINFGVVRAIQATGAAATRKVEMPAFTAPERLQGGEAEPAADMFSWAATIVYAASGRSPFEGGSMAGTVNRIVNGEPEVPELGDLRELVLTCLAKDPARRPSASEALLRLVGETGFLTESVNVAVPGAGTAPPAGAGAGPGAGPGAPPPPSGLPYDPPPSRGATVPVRRGGMVALAVAVAFLAGAVLSGGAVYTLTGREGTAAAAPGASPPGGRASVITTPPPITPGFTSAPVSSVAPKAKTDTELPDIGATLYEHPDDGVRFTSYLQYKHPYRAFVRAPSGEFEPVGSIEEPVLSPDGTWVALNPGLKFHNSDRDHIGFTNLTTGEKFTVNTVKKPNQTVFPIWSRDGRRLLLSAVDEKREYVLGFVLVDVAARTATVVRTEWTDDGSLIFTFTPDGTVARGYSTGDSHGIQFYDLSGKVIRTMNWVGKPRYRDWYSPSGKLFATICPKVVDVCVWNATTGTRVATVPIPDDVGLLGWFNEDHLLIETRKKGGRGEIKIVNFVGEVKRVLADISPKRGVLHFAPVVR